MSNLFLVRDEVLITPELDRAGIRGLARDVIIDIATCNGMDVDIREVKPEELDDAAELFVCNSLIGIWPITRLDNRRYPVGPRTSLLQQELAEVMC
jgi:4-amino-4-deoxychorismate lyase